MAESTKNCPVIYRAVFVPFSNRRLEQQIELIFLKQKYNNTHIKSCYSFLKEIPSAGTVSVREGFVLKEKRVGSSAKVHGKLHKVLHSRYLWVVLGLVLSVAQLLAVFILLYEYFMPVTVLAVIFHVGVLLYVFNRDEVPELKVPWLTILFLFPVVGAFVYMLFTNTEQNKKEVQRLMKARQQLAAFQRQPEGVMEELEEKDGEAYMQASYLYHAAGMPCREGKAAYYPLGERFHEALLESLREAEYFIFMEYFIIQRGQMWDPIHEVLKEKAAQGVTVCLMYDDFGCMATLPDRYYEEMQAEGIRCIPSNKFRAVLSRIHNNRDHRKITVIDGKVGFTGGLNLADEYMNVVEKYGHWKDTAVKIEGEAVKNLTALFIEFWNMQSGEPLDLAAYLRVKTPTNPDKGLVIPYGAGPEPFYQDPIGKNVYLNMIHGAKKYLYLTTPYLICDYELMSALKIAAKKGVDVRLVTPHIPDKKLVFLMTRSSYRSLIASGVKIYEYTPGFVHAKNMVCDDKFAVCGTINMDYRSLVHHFECAAWMYGTESVAQMKDDFLETIACSEQVTAEMAKLKWWQHLLAEVLKVFTPLL